MGRGGSGALAPDRRRGSPAATEALRVDAELGEPLLKLLAMETELVGGPRDVALMAGEGSPEEVSTYLSGSSRPSRAALSISSRE